MDGEFPALSEVGKTLLQTGTPGVLGVFTSKAVEDSVAQGSGTTDWVLGGVGLFLGVYAVNSNLGIYGKNFAGGIIIGSTWQILDEACSRFTQADSLSDFLYDFGSTGGGG